MECALPFTEGWLGGDSGTSLQLADKRVLWVFGDTFVDPSGKTPSTGADRRHSVFIHNSIAISKSNDFLLTPDYIWNELAGTPKSFFRLDVESEPPAQQTGLPHERSSRRFLWPLASVFLRDSVFIALTVVEASSDALGFELKGTRIVRIRNWREDAAKWQQEMVFSSDASDFSAVASMVIDGSHLNLVHYGADRQMQLSQIPIQKLLDTDLNPSLEKLGPINLEGDSEFTVVFDKQIRKWMAVQVRQTRTLQLIGEKISPHAPKQTPIASEIIVQYADALAGPWTAAETLLKIPETDPSSSKFNPNAFCYAAKVHPWAESWGSRELLASYVCNLMQVEEIYLPSAWSYYTPQFFVFGRTAKGLKLH